MKEIYYYSMVCSHSYDMYIYAYIMALKVYYNISHFISLFFNGFMKCMFHSLRKIIQKCGHDLMGVNSYSDFKDISTIFTGSDSTKFVILNNILKSIFS